MSKTPEDISEQSPALSSLSRDDISWLETNFAAVKEMLENGVSGSFTTADSKTVTVTRGIITEIV